nr:MAG TPA: TFIIB Transcription factor zinc-finger [Caudoviricetes sp.]
MDSGIVFWFPDETITPAPNSCGRCGGYYYS